MIGPLGISRRNLALSEPLVVCARCTHQSSAVIFLFVCCPGQFWFRREVETPTGPCAISPSCTTTETTPTVLLRAGGTTWNGAEQPRTMTPTRSLGSAPWLVRWGPVSDACGPLAACECWFLHSSLRQFGEVWYTCMYYILRLQVEKTINSTDYWYAFKIPLTWLNVKN